MAVLLWKIPQMCFSCSWWLLRAHQAIVLPELHRSMLFVSFISCNTFWNSKF